MADNSEIVDFHLPPVLGHYRLQDKLGQGGMGVVYKALDMRLDRPVALKVLPPEKLTNAERKRRFVQEAKAASALNHPNIVTIHDIGEEQGIDFLVMEFIAGNTLDRLIPRQGMPLGELLRIATQIADGLTAAHAAGITHRDLKPSNIMVSDTGQTKILDFGLAKLTDRADMSAEDRTMTAAPVTSEGAILGTVHYMSPEQAEGKKVDARSDIFSFGCVLYEMASGRRAFQGDTPASTLGAVIHKEPEPLASVSPVAPRDLDRIVARCLRKDRDRRYQGMADLRVALLELKEESDSGRLLAAPPTVAVKAKRAPAALLAAVAAVVLLGLGAGWWVWSSRGGGAKQQQAARQTVVRQITRDSGSSAQPVISPDGKLLAYVSDRAEQNNIDIWVQQMAGGQPVRLTRHPAADFRPQFSADGTTIYFYSQRPERAVWAIPALGGEERLVSREPVVEIQMAPNGQYMAATLYITAGEQAKLVLLSPAGGVLRKIPVDPLKVFSPSSWDKDSTVIFGNGTEGRSAGDPFVPYAVSINGAFPPRRLPGLPAGGRFRVDGERLLVGHQGAIDEYRLSAAGPEFSVSGPVQRWAQFPGAGLNFDVSGGTIIAAASYSVEDLWSLPIDSGSGKVKGPPVRLTDDQAADGQPSISADGRRLLFASNRYDGRSSDLWLRDLDTGKDTQITSTPDNELRGWISPDGTRAAYEVERSPLAIFVRDLAGGDAKPVCTNCSLPGWTPDSRKVVFWEGDPIRFYTWDVETGARKPLVSHPDRSVQTARVSPDGRWVSFHLQGQQQQRPTEVWIAPLHDGTAGPPAEWIRIEGDSGIGFIHAWWSPDGGMLYFLSRSGRSRLAIFGQALDPATKRPRGQPVLVFAPDSNFILSPFARVGLSMSRDRLVFSMMQSRSNLWRIE